MYSNLRKALLYKNISFVSYAKMLGITDKSVQNKLNGVTEFTLREVLATMELFPEYRVEYLFAIDEKSA